MTETISTAIKPRQFLGQDFQLSTWESVQPFYENLKNRNLSTAQELRSFFADRSELESYLSENMAWRYIRMSCDNANQANVQAYQSFVTDILPHTSLYDDDLNKKVVESPFLDDMKETGFNITIRAMKRAIEIFREENIPINTELQTLSTQFGAITGAMMVTINGEEKTLQQAGVFLENPDRNLREETYTKVQGRRFEDKRKVRRFTESTRKIASSYGSECWF
jgi:oligoendopeptidase F